jgi:hypothetical protein
MQLISVQLKNLGFHSLIILLLIGCTGDSITTFENNNERNNNDLLDPNIKYQESYDELTITLGVFWPSDIVKGASKTSISSDSHILLDYENVYKSLGFDEDGNMIRSYELLEGTFSMDMPETLFDDIKDRMPSRDTKGEIGSYLMKNGTISYFDLEGGLINEYSYPISDFQVDPELINSMNMDSTESVESRVQENIEQLQNSYTNFKIVESNFAIVNIDSDGQDAVSFEKLIDLRTGFEIQSAVILPNGSYESVMSMSYNTVNGIPIMSNSETLLFGMQNDEWGVTKKRVTTRKNIQVIIK